MISSVLQWCSSEFEPDAGADDTESSVDEQNRMDVDEVEVEQTCPKCTPNANRVQRADVTATHGVTCEVEASAPKRKAAPTFSVNRNNAVYVPLSKFLLDACHTLLTVHHAKPWSPHHPIPSNKLPK